MKEKKTFYCEIAYVIGITILAFGTALMEKADFGLSMVVAPAYIIHLKVSQYFPFYSFGISEYVFQACLLGILSLLMHKVKKSYILSFVTVLFYGMILDVFIFFVSLFPMEGIVWQILFYISGMLICATGVAFLFHTYLPPASYELAVKEIASKYNVAISKTKTIYDCCSCILSVILSLVFFGAFVGIYWGTVVCAIFNGWLIGKISLLLENTYVFKDAFSLREYLK